MLKEQKKVDVCEAVLALYAHRNKLEKIIDGLRVALKRDHQAIDACNLEEYINRKNQVGLAITMLEKHILD